MKCFCLTTIAAATTSNTTSVTFSGLTISVRVFCHVLEPMFSTL